MEPILRSASTLAILYGASAFPQKPNIPAFSCFQRSVERFRQYLEESLGVYSDNIYDLFDQDLLPPALRRSIKEWLGKRQEACGGKISDVFFFYVGHGETASGVLRLAGRCTIDGDEESSLSSKGLKDVLYTTPAAIGANFYVILDCCYGHAAHKDFQDTPSKSPAVLYTAASARATALANDKEAYTRFSNALFSALAQGVEGSEECLSFRLLESSVNMIYQQQHPDDYVKPQLGAPNNPIVDVLNYPMFPNPAFKEAPRHYEYYTNWIRRHGVPEGLGLLKQEEVKRRKISTRVLREHGRIRKVETVNSAGRLIANYYATALLGGSQDDAASEECSWEFVYGENGRVAREEARNAFGRLLYRCEYSVSDEAETTARYFLNLSDVVQPRAKSGAAFVKIHRNSSGLDERLEFFDGLGQNQPDDRGSYGQAREFNAEGVVIKAVELDRSGQPAICNDGYAIARFTTNPFGDTTSQAYFDAAGKPILHKDGYHKAVIEWSPDGDLTAMEIFGTQEGERTLLKSGWASWKAGYDSAGYQTEQEYFGLDGEPVIMGDGCASWKAIFDAHGRMTEYSFFDTEGKPTYSRDGLTRIAYGYDASGQINEYKYLEADGVTPALDRDGVARITLTFDGDGNLIKQLQWGAEGKLTRNRDGVVGFASTFDASGNQTSVSYIDVDGNVGLDNSGIAKIRYSYDNRRRETERSYFDASDVAVEDSDGHHRVVSIYDQIPGRVITRYFARSGEAAPLNGPWASIAQYDDRGRMEGREYWDSKDQPCWNAKGYASEQREYNAMSLQVSESYFGLDRKLVIASMGYASWVAEYDARGNLSRKVYLDATGAPMNGRPIESFAYDAYGNYTAKFLNVAGDAVLNEDGVTERRVERDAFGNDKKSTYWGFDGKPAKRKEGVAGWEASYDRFQNKVEQRLLDENGTLTSQQNGTARTTWTYDSRQRSISEAYWDVQGNRFVLLPEGYAGWNIEYDDRGHEIERTYFGADGKLTDMQYGYAHVVADYLKESRVVRRGWFNSKGNPIWNLLASYDSHGCRTETAPSAMGGTVIRKFDRAGREIRCTYLRVDGAPDVYRELDFAYSRFEEDFDQYGRSTEKRYYDTGDKLFRSIRKTYDPAGREMERVQTDSSAIGNRQTCTRFPGNGTQIEISLTDAQGNAVADEFGRAKWIEHLDAQGRRAKLEYFDTAGQPKTFHGHFWSEYKYDALGCLNEAVYSFPVEEESTFNRKFKFGLKGSPRVGFQSAGADGQTEQQEGYLVEYRMQTGDETYYATRVDSASYLEKVEKTKIELRIRQVCQEVRPDGSYMISMNVVVLDANGKASPAPSVELRMTRTGRMLETSLQSGFETPPMPAYPLFAGDTWLMQNNLQVPNPFTNVMETVGLNYSYTLNRIITTESGLRLAQIEVSCPETRVPLEPAGAWTISASGVNLFEVEKGSLFASQVKCRTVITAGNEELATEVEMKLHRYEPQPQSSTADA
jgi:hypothetical protein